MQLQGQHGLQGQNSCYSAVVGTVYRTNGLSGFYQGILAEYCKVVPGCCNYILRIWNFQKGNLAWVQTVEGAESWECHRSLSGSGSVFCLFSFCQPCLTAFEIARKRVQNILSMMSMLQHPLFSKHTRIALRPCIVLLCLRTLRSIYTVAKYIFSTSSSLYSTFLSLHVGEYNLQNPYIVCIQQAGKRDMSVNANE